MTIDIDAIRRRVNRSTGGSWTLRERRSLDRRVLAVVSEGEGEMTYADIAEVPLEPGDDINDWRNDAEFIAHARNDVPALLAELDRVRADLAAAHNHADGLATNVRGLQRVNHALANENAELKASVQRLIAFRNLKVWEADELAKRLKAARALAQGNGEEFSYIYGGDLLTAIGDPHPAESRPAFVPTEAEVSR